MTVVPTQRKGKAGTSVVSLSIGSGDGWVTPTPGNLLVVSGNSDATLTMTTAGFTAGPSVVDGNGAYVWFKQATGAESTITITPGSAATTSMTALEIPGLLLPIDASNSSIIAGVGGTTTTAASVTTTAAADFVLAFALIHSVPAAGAMATGPSWSNGFVNRLSITTAGVGGPDSAIFVGELNVGGAGSYSTVCTWTNNMNDRQHIIVAFRAADDVPSRPIGRRVLR